MENDIRADATEGVGYYNHTNASGHNIQVTTVSSNEHYIQCFSAAGSRKGQMELACRFSGPDQFLVPCIEITDAKLYIRKIAAGLETSKYSQGIIDLNWHEVEYSKFEDRDKQEPPLDLHVYQKPKKHIIYRYKNRKTGKSLTLHPSWRISDSVDKYEQKYLPSEIWEKIHDHSDYTCEREWRLAVGLHRKSKLQKIGAPVFEEKDVLINRISKKHHISEDSVKAADQSLFDFYKTNIDEYIHHINVDSEINFEDCIRRKNVYVWSRLLSRIYWTSTFEIIFKTIVSKHSRITANLTNKDKSREAAT